MSVAGEDAGGIGCSCNGSSLLLGLRPLERVLRQHAQEQRRERRREHDEKLVRLARLLVAAREVGDSVPGGRVAARSGLHGACLAQRLMCKVHQSCPLWHEPNGRGCAGA